MSPSKPIVAIVGRPNVGKSTLFNRIIGRFAAIVSNKSGTTRDRIIAETTWADRTFNVIDTGGLEALPADNLLDQVNDQVEVAIRESDVVLMVTDITLGVTPGDKNVAHILRTMGKPVILAANKSDTDQKKLNVYDFYELGMGDPLPISAYHNLGIDDMMERIVEKFPPGDPTADIAANLRLAIVGRTNVGKSMLLNAFSHEERAIVSDKPGTTRDPLDTLISHRDSSVMLIDTAGIRRAGKIERGIESYSVLRSIRAIDRADVSALVVDVTEPTTSQDTHIASYILDAFRGIVLVVNKWDLAGSQGLTREAVERSIRRKFKFIPYAPICFVSALNTTGINNLLDTTFKVHQEWSKGVPRYHLRRTVMTAVAEHPPAVSGRRTLKILGVTQDQTSPPSFTFYVNRSDMVHFSYQRYLENRLRDAYSFLGCPLRMRFKGRKDLR